MKTRVYHMVIGRKWEESHGDDSTRKEYLSCIQGDAPAGYICIGVCGYHDTPATWAVLVTPTRRGSRFTPVTLEGTGYNPHGAAYHTEEEARAYIRAHGGTVAAVGGLWDII